MSAESIAELRKVQASDASPFSSALLAYAYAAAGLRGDPDKALEELKGISQQRHVVAGMMVIAYLGLGEKERALGWKRAMRNTQFA